MTPFVALLLPLALLAAPTVPRAAASAPDAAGAPACGADLDTRQRRLLTSRHQVVAFAPRPAPLVVGRHFGLDIMICPRPGASLPLTVRVDADMPAHQHGMNYRPTVRALGEGRYRADGLMLHMPGRWRLLFELTVDGRIDRLSHEVDLE